MFVFMQEPSYATQAWSSNERNVESALPWAFFGLTVDGRTHRDKSHMFAVRFFFLSDNFASICIVHCTFYVQPPSQFSSLVLHRHHRRCEFEAHLLYRCDDSYRIRQGPSKDSTRPANGNTLYILIMHVTNSSSVSDNDGGTLSLDQLFGREVQAMQSNSSNIMPRIPADHYPMYIWTNRISGGISSIASMVMIGIIAYRMIKARREGHNHQYAVNINNT